MLATGLLIFGPRMDYMPYSENHYERKYPMFQKAINGVKENKDLIVGFVALSLISLGAALVGSAVGEIAGRGIAIALGLGDPKDPEN